MSITLHVSLLSGRRVSLDTGLDIDVESFKRQAQRALSVGKGRLIDSRGSVLDGAKTIRVCGLQNDDALNLQIRPVMMLANRDSPGFLTDAAFAAVLSDGSLVTWGHLKHGGDSSAVQDELGDVQQIQASRWAFAGILDDGSVVTWGHAAFGGDKNSVQLQLKNVQQIQATERSFASILADGYVGRRSLWWRQQCCARSAAKRPADSSV